MKGRVLVAMSGGVDSSVASLLLKEEGYDVTGVSMELGIEDNGKSCGIQGIEDAKRVSFKLKIPHYTIDFSKDLEEKVIFRFVSEYLNGRTPNPCVDCNRFLKFGALLDKALSLGFDFLATGHYAKIDKDNGNFILRRAKDREKDQSYFLYHIKKESLKSILFPLADLTKEEVRRIAKENDLSIANKPQSQDICFIKNRDYRKFILQRIGNNIRYGDIVDIEGNILGMHKGIFSYTIGQRKGIGISNKRALYVISKDIKRNQIIIGPREYLQATGLIAGDLNLLVDRLPSEAFAQIRYSQREAKCEIFHLGKKLKVIFKEKQEAITPGQSIVFYDRDRVLGGGVIEEVLW